MPSEATVFVVDDDPGVRSALYELLSYSGFNVEPYTNAQEFLDACDPDKPGCLVLDVRMPIMSGLVLLEQLEKHAIELPVIILTGHGDVQMAVNAFKHGAVEFLEKPFDNQALVAAVSKAVALDAELRRHSAFRKNMEKRLAKLTEREQEVLDKLVAGQPHKVIAADLGLSLSSIETHRKHILEKLEARDQAELLRIVLCCRASEA